MQVQVSESPSTAVTVEGHRNPLSEFVFLRTYARWIPEQGRRELAWGEAVDRYVGWVSERRDVPLTVVDAIRSHMMSMGVLPSMRALWSAGVAADRDNVTVYNCLGAETEFITSEGVRKFSDFSDGDRIKVLTHTGSWKPAVVRSYGEQRLYEIDVARGRSAYTVRSTRNHQWVLRDGSRTNALEKGMHLAKPPSIVGSWRYEDSNPVERYYWALGYVYGDGTLVKDREGNYGYSMVRLCGADKGRFLERFRELGFNTSEPPTFGGDAVAYTGKYLKTLPTVDGDGYENVVAFVRGFLDADGHKNPNGDCPSPFNGIQSSGGESIDFIRSMFPVVGAYITREDDRTGDQTNFGTRPETSYFGLVLGFGDSHNSTFSVQDIRESTVETVWCLEVEDDHSFVLPNGIVTGNCSFLPVDNLRAFSEALYILMCGTGVGFSVEREFTDNLPVVASSSGETVRVVVEDSTEGWADALYGVMVALWRGHHVEYDVSKVRLRGEVLKTKGGRASGPEPLVNLFDLCANTVRSAVGRRLSPIEVHDIMCTIGEIVMVGGFRRAALISFSDLDDAEMRHAKDWSLGDFPKCRYMANNSAHHHVRPTRDVFDREWSALRASGSGERGLYRMPVAKRAARRGDCRSNPCVTGSTWVNTVDGPRQVSELIDTPFTAVVDGAAYPSTDAGFWSTGVKPVLRLETEEGYTLDLTGNHRVCRVTQTARAQRFEWVPAEQLAPGDLVRLNNHRAVSVDDPVAFDKGWLLGSLIGDGTFSCVEGKADLGVLTYWGPHARDMAEAALDRINRVGLPHRSDLSPVYNKANDTWRVVCVALADLAREYGVVPGNKVITPAMERESESFAAGVLSGLFDADGCVLQAKGASVRLAQSNMDTLVAAQRMLLRLGIASSIYENRRDAGFRLMPDGHGGEGEYWCQASHELSVSRDNIFRFAEVVGFSSPDKTAKVGQILGSYVRTPNRERFVARVKALEPVGEQEVYDCTIPDLSAFDANGLYVHNCGEILLRYRKANDPWTGEGGGGQFCVSGDTPLITREGLTTIQESVGHPVHVWNGERWSEVRPFQTGIGQKLNRVRFSDGSYLDCTDYHRFSVSNRNTRGTKNPWREMTVAEIREAGVDKRWGTEPFRISHDEGEVVDDTYTLGAAVGDGWVRKTSGGGNPNPRVYTGLWGAKDARMPVVGTYGRERVVGNNAVAFRAVFCPDQNPELVTALKTDAEALGVVFTWCRESILQFLAGWLDADGTQCGPGRVRLYLSKESRARTVQLLLTRCGIRSSVGILAEAGSATNLGVRNDSLFYVDITDCADIPCHRLDTSLGHTPRFKSKFQTIRSIEELPGLHATFCFEEAERHMGVFGNTLTYQCNLSAAVMRSDDTVDTMVEKIRVATWIGAIQASFTDFPYLRPAWKELCDEDRLLGVDITGQCDNPALSQDPAAMSMFNRVARETAAEATAWLGINYPAAITCGKPSGNSSQLVDCASGFHPRYAPYYIRRVRTDAKDPLTHLLRDAGVPMHKENGMDHLSDSECPVWVVEFPVAAPQGAMLRDSETAIQMLERYLHVMRTWCGERGHNQSITVYVRDHEWDEVGDFVFEHFDEITGVSFLPYSGGKYKLAPYEEIDEATYRDMVSRFPTIAYDALPLYEGTDLGQGAQELACMGGGCEIV